LAGHILARVDSFSSIFINFLNKGLIELSLPYVASSVDNQLPFSQTITGFHSHVLPCIPLETWDERVSVKLPAL
jgi:hypothetical protein